MRQGSDSAPDGAYPDDDGRPRAGPWLALTFALLALGYLVLLAL